jgi:hypothetical protein
MHRTEKLFGGIKMKSTVYCTTTEKSVQTFYLVADGKEYYLFRQNYRRSVAEYYRCGVTVNEAINFGRSKHNTALINTMEKLPAYIRYIEKEYGIEVLKQTAKKNNRRKQSLAA